VQLHGAQPATVSPAINLTLPARSPKGASRRAGAAHRASAEPARDLVRGDADLAAAGHLDRPQADAAQHAGHAQAGLGRAGGLLAARGPLAAGAARLGGGRRRGALLVVWRRGRAGVARGALLLGAPARAAHQTLRRPCAAARKRARGARDGHARHLDTLRSSTRTCRRVCALGARGGVGARERRRGLERGERKGRAWRPWRRAWRRTTGRRSGSRRTAAPGT